LDDERLPHHRPASSPTLGQIVERRDRREPHGERA